MFAYIWEKRILVTIVHLPGHHAQGHGLTVHVLNPEAGWEWARLNSLTSQKR